MTCTEEYAIIFYDGECGFCNGWVKYVIKHDYKDYFKFCSLHSKAAQEYAQNYHFSIENKNSIALLENGRVSRQALAARKIAVHLDTKFNWESFISFFPLPIANIGYKIISKIRYLLPGGFCEIQPELQSRFIA